MLSSSSDHHSQLHGLQFPFWHFSHSLFLCSILFFLFLLSFLFYFHIPDICFLLRIYDSMSLSIELFSLLNKNFLANFSMLCMCNLVKRPSTISALQKIWIIFRSVHWWLIVSVLWYLELAFFNWDIINCRFWTHVKIHLVSLRLYLLPLRSSFTWW